MARLSRVAPVGVPQRVIQRGNDRQACFGGESGMAAYAGWLKEYAKKFEVDILAWIFMTNHVQFSKQSVNRITARPGLVYKVQRGALVF